MKEYICGVVGSAMVISILMLMLPDSASEKELRLLGAVALICVIAAPLAGAAGRVRGFFESGIGEVTAAESAGGVSDGLIAALEEQSADEIGAALRDKICGRFGLDEADVTVRPQVAVKDGAVTLERVFVIFTGRAMWQDPHAVKEYVESVAGVPCEVAEG